MYNSLGQSELWFLGYWIGDGSLTVNGVGSHCSNVSGNKDHESRILPFIKPEWLGAITYREGKHAFQLNLRKPFTDWVRSLGFERHPAHEKQVPKELWKPDLLAGLWDADGTDKTNCALTTTSPYLAEMATSTLASVGIIASVGRYDYGRPKYHIRVGRPQKALFRQEIQRHLR